MSGFETFPLRIPAAAVASAGISMSYVTEWCAESSTLKICPRIMDCASISRPITIEWDFKFCASVPRNVTIAVDATIVEQCAPVTTAIHGQLAVTEGNDIDNISTVDLEPVLQSENAAQSTVVQLPCRFIFFIICPIITFNMK